MQHENNMLKQENERLKGKSNNSFGQILITRDPSELLNDYKMQILNKIAPIE